MSKPTKFFLTLFLAGMILVPVVSLAQEDMVALDEDIQPQDLGIGEPRLLPDNPFYFFKEIGRGIRTFFAFDPVAKAELKLKFANEKIIEAKKLVEKKKDPEIIKKGLENYQREIEKIKVVSEKIKVKAAESPEVSSFLDKFTKHQILHHRILQKLETQVPPEALEKIKEAREEHITRFSEIMIELEDRKEKMQERLEKNMEDIKGSEFKEFKNLEVLKELEGKMPEETKEIIKKVQEKSLIKLKEKLEQLPPEGQEKFKEYVEKISGTKEKQMEILENLRIKTPELQLQQKIIESKDIILEKIKLKEAEKQEKEKPQVCITLWDPVCGKDGKTYSNSCFAKLAGVEIVYEGECKGDGQKKQIQIKEAPKLE